MSESIDAGGSSSAGTLEFLISMVDKFSSPMEKAVGHVEKLKAAFTGLAVAGAEIFGGFEFLKHTVEPAMEFEQAQLKLARATDATAEQLRAAQEQADRLSTTYGATAEDVTKLQDVLSRFTGSLDESMKATELGAQVMAATGMDAAAAGKILGVALTDLRKPGQTAQDAMQETADKVTLLLNKFPAAGVSASRMARDIAKTATTVKTFHLDMDQALGLLAELNRTGIAGERGSGMLFESMVNSLLKLNSKGIPAYTKFFHAVVMTKDGTMDLIQTLAHASKEEMTRFAQSVGMSGQAMMLLVDHLHDAWVNQQKFKNASGETMKDAQKATETAEVAVRNFENAWIDLKVQLGQALLPAITHVANAIAGVTRVILEFLDTHEEFRKAFAIGAEVAALSLTFIGLFTAMRAGIFVVRALSAALLANPWVAIITAIIVAAVEIYQNWEWVKATWAEGYAWIAEHGEWIQNDIRAVAAVIKGAFDAVVNMKWSDILNPTQLALIKAAVADIRWAFEALSNAMSAVWREIKEIVGGAVDWVLNKVEFMAKGIRNIIGAVQWVGSAVGSGISAVGRQFGPSALTPEQGGNYGVGPSPPAPGARVNNNVQQQITNSPQITVTVGQTNASGTDVASAVSGAVTRANQSLSDQMAKQAESNSRSGYGDSRFSAIPQ